MITDSPIEDCFAVMYSLVEGLRVCKYVVHAWNSVRVEGGGYAGVNDIVLLGMIGEHIFDS